MKKFFTTALLTVALISGAFAAKNINSKAESKFQASFPGAQHVAMSNSNDHTTISFSWNGQDMKAFYDNEGNELAVSRNIQLASLPARAQKTIQNKYSDYTATEAIEFDHTQDGISYFVSLQNDSNKIILQISSQGEINVFKKTKL